MNTGRMPRQNLAGRQVVLTPALHEHPGWPLDDPTIAPFAVMLDGAVVGASAVTPSMSWPRT